MALILKSPITYNGNSQLDESITEDWNGTVWNNSLKQVNTYNGSNLITDLSLTWNVTVWDSSNKTENVYVGNNLIESTDLTYASGWFDTEKRIRTYNGNNQVLAEVQQAYQNPNWINTRKDSFQYNMSNKLTMVISYTWNNSLWEQEDRSMITWTGNRITEVEIQEWDGTNWDNIEKYNYTYNGNDYPSTEIATYWNGTAYVYDPNNDSYKMRYYYESYNNNVGLNDVASEVFGTIKIFPNPANDYVTVDFDNKTNSKKEAVVLDMAGAVISKTIILSSENSVRIPMNQLATGNYLLQLRDESGSVVSKKISKQ